MNKAMKTVLLSMSTLCVATTLIVGGTYALFTDTVNVNNHLKAGTLDVALERVSYQTNMLGADGLMIQSDADLSVVDLAAEGASLFSFENAVPTSWAKATIKVSNLGNVAFTFGMKMLWNDDGEQTAEQVEFAKQVQITVNSGQDQKQYMLNDCANEANVWNNMSDVLVGNDTAKEFTIKAEFIDDANNNTVQSISLDFDFQVFATQKTN